jgi:hypothetical protein
VDVAGWIRGGGGSWEGVTCRVTWAGWRGWIRLLSGQEELSAAYDMKVPKFSKLKHMHMLHSLLLVSHLPAAMLFPFKMSLQRRET